jgi:hypothetical protein
MASDVSWDVPLPEPGFHENEHMKCPRIVQEQVCLVEPLFAGTGSHNMWHPCLLPCICMQSYKFFHSRPLRWYAGC